MPDINVKVRVDESEFEKLEKKLNKNNKVNIDVSSIGKAGREVQNLDTSIKNIAATKLKFDAFRLLQQHCSEAVKSVKELNEAMTLVKMTMLDLPDGKLQDLASQSLEMSKELSAYTKTVTDAVTIFANANESVAGILNKAQPTVLLATAANMSASNAADTIQGIINQFEMTDDQAMKIADTIEKLSSEIALDFSKGVSTISEAVSTGGSVINEAGMSFERYGAIVSATAERTRLSGSVIGNAYKTIAARISRSKDGETLSEDIAKAEEAFNSVGVTIRNEMGDFRDLSETLDDLNSVWGSLNKSQRSYVAEQAAGVRQKNVFIAMMNEYSRVLELEEAALNASGTAMEINEVRAESIDGKMQKLSATMSEMYNHAVPEDAIKGMLDFATSVMEVVDNLGLMQGALAAVGVVGVSNMVNVLKTHWQSIFSAITSPTSLVAIGVGTAVAAWSAYQRSIEEAVSSAREAASVWAETNSSLEEQAQRVKELREELAKGNLTEEEAYQTKSDLFDIQQQLSESYGDQADGIDLVNGKLETQIGLIEQLSKSQANEFLNENMKGIKEAEKKMTKSIGGGIDGSFYLGQFFNDGTSADVLKNIISKYNDYITTQTDIDGITTNVYFKGDATSAKEVLNDFMTDIRNAEGEINDKNILDGFQTNVSAGLKTANEVIDEYQDLYKQAQQARLIADENLYGTGETQKTAIEWVNEYTKAVGKYNDAILSGDNSKISDAAMEFDTVNASIQDLVANSDMSKYADQVGEVRDQLNDIAIVSLNFKNALAGTDTSDLGKQLKSYAENLKELNLKDVDFRIALETDGTQQGEKAIKGLADAADEAGLSVDQLINILTELGYIQGEIADNELDVEVPVSLSISETIDQLNKQLRPAFDSLKSAYDDIFTTKGFTLENVDLSMLDSIKSALDDLNKDENGIAIDYSSFEEFARVLTDTSSTADDVHNAINSLATDIVGALNPSISQCSGENYKLVQSLLESVGIMNSEEVMISSLGYSYAEYIAAKEGATQAGFDLANATESEIDAFVQEQIESGNCGEALALLQLKKLLVNSTTINTAADVQQIMNLASAASMGAEVLSQLASAKSILSQVESGKVVSLQSYEKALSDIDSAKQKMLDWQPVEVKFDSNTEGAKKAGSSAGKSYKDAFKEKVDELNSVISGVMNLIGKQIDAYSDSKNAAVSSLKEELSARLEVIDAQKEQLQEQIKLIDAQIKSKQKIIDSIRSEVQSMRDANDERERQRRLQEALYNQRKAEEQHNILQYSNEKGMHYVNDSSEARKAKDEVDEVQFEIEIAQKEKQIKLIEREIDLLNERKSEINDQIDLLDAQKDQINDYYNKLISETERYWDSLIESIQNYKDRWQELSEVEDQAKLISKLKELGITTDDITNMSAEAFEKFKDRYLAVLIKVNEGNADVQNSIAELGDSAGSIQPVSDAINNASDSMNALSGSSSSASQSVSDTASNLDTAATNARTLRDNLTDVNTTISEEQNAFGNLKQTINEVIEAINNKIEAINDEQRAVGIATSSEMADFLLLRDKIVEVKESIDEVRAVVTDLDTQTLDNITNSFQGLYDKIILVSSTLGSGIEGSGEGVTNSISSAIQALNDISLEEGIIAQFNNLKTAIDSVTSALSGGGGGLSGGQGQSGQSASNGVGSESGSQGGAANSLSGAITEMGDTANEVIGEPDAEGDGTVIGEFGAMKTAVNDVTEAIGIGGDEGSSGSGSGQDDDGTLIGSINDLGTTTEEIVGERGEEDTIIGRFEQFRDVIGEAASHVASISEGLDEIDGKEVECTITVNVKMNGSIPAFASGTVLGNMKIESATYNAQYGKAYASGTIGLPKAEKNALISEYGQTEMTVFPNGKTVITDSPTMMDLPKDTVIFNEEETKKIIGNKSNINGTAHAQGTVDDGVIITGDGHVLRPLQPGDRAYEFQQKMNDYLARTGEDVKAMLTPVNAMQKNMEQMTQALNTINNISNNNRTQSISIGDINVTCPGVTSAEVAKQVGIELGRQFRGLHLAALQESMKR